jgi:hypothetical protein
MLRHHRADGFEVQPAKSFGRKHQPIQRRLKSRRFCGGWRHPAGWFSVSSAKRTSWHFQFRHGIVKFLALAANDGLDRKVKTAIRATGNLGAITASRAFKQVRAAHADHCSLFGEFLQSEDFLNLRGESRSGLIHAPRPDGW